MILTMRVVLMTQQSTPSAPAHSPCTQRERKRINAIDFHQHGLINGKNRKKIASRPFIQMNFIFFHLNQKN